MKPQKDGRKQHTCKFCKKRVFKIPRHLEDCHPDISEVVHALAYPQRSKERRAVFAKIRQEGDYKPSVERLKSKDQAIAVRKGKADNELLPCPNCYGFLGQSSCINIQSTVLQMSFLVKKIRKEIC